MPRLSSFCVLMFCVLMLVPGLARAEEYWCTYDPNAPTNACATCSMDPACYEPACPEMAPWCAAADVCPRDLEPTFCAGNPEWERCVYVAYTVCDESASVWCCAPADVLPAEWFCPTGRADECHAPDNPCLYPECWPIAWPVSPGPNGESKKCSYQPKADGEPCNDGGTCSGGVCIQ